MSVYRSTYALTKLFGVIQTESDLAQEKSSHATFPFLSNLSPSVTRIGYSTRLQFTDFIPTTYRPPKLQDIDSALAANLHELHNFITQLIDNKTESNLPIIITHSFTLGEIDISAKSPLITAIIEEAMNSDHGKHYRILVWDTFELLKSSCSDDGAIYLLNAQHNTVTALSNTTALQIQIEAKPGEEG